MEKVSKIEFHCNFYELNDFILKAADLIKEGYKLYTVTCDNVTVSYNSLDPEPCIHITLWRQNK